jgi:5-methylcytosine-specific restriction endonuclease McrA
MTYAQKLQHPKWQQVRLRLFEDKNWRCEDCGAADRNLQVHHHCYLRGREPWEYPLDMLRVLCQECHHERQELEDNIRTAQAHIFRSVPNKRLYRYAQAMFERALEEME